MIEPLDIENQKQLYSIEQKKAEFAFAMEEKRYKSCCFDLHAESSSFFAKLIISIGVSSLCGYQLVTLKQCEYQSLYSSLLSSIIVFWLNKK